MEIDRNDPAFPAADYNQCFGVTKREYYAGLALQGILARNAYMPEDAAQKAVQCADALINELQRY